MGKKTVVVIVLVLAAILAIAGFYFMTEAPGVNVANDDLAVYSQGPLDLNTVIEDVETGSYYEGYDNETLNWMKSLGEKAVFSGNGTFVIMDFHDAEKIPTEYATDVEIIEHFKCEIVEQHSLGNVDYHRDVLLVRNVEYLGEEVIDLGLA